jgi:EAL domain-containing protein (putative c-di-GMP-specific phosphodiesterase class I)
MVTETIIDFARKMNIQTIAEFVHSQSVFEVVKNMGIDFAQGYYFGKPQKLD